MANSLIANWIAFGGLAFLVCTSSITFAFGLGKVFERVGQLRKDLDGVMAGSVADAQVAVELARLDERMKHIEDGQRDLTAEIARANPKPHQFGGVP